MRNKEIVGVLKISGNYNGYDYNKVKVICALPIHKDGYGNKFAEYTFDAKLLEGKVVRVDELLGMCVSKVLKDEYGKKIKVIEFEM